MTIRHFTIFKEVYEQCSMTKAAKNLFMTQPSVSQAIKELENHYQVTLFERLSNKLYPTSASQHLYTQCCIILSHYQDLENSLDSTTAASFRIGLNYTTGLTLIQDLLDLFEEKFPEIHPQICVNKASYIREMIKRNDLDFALIEAAPSEGELIQEEFMEDQILIACCPSHPYAHKEICLQELSLEPILCREAGVGSRELFFQRMQEAGFSILPQWESISVSSLINACIKNRGIAILPYEAAKPYLANHQIAPIYVKNLNLNRKLVIAYHKDKFLSKPMLEFFSICKKYGSEMLPYNLT